MARPYSFDLRERVVSAVESGEACRVVAVRFGVAVSSVVKWSQRYRMTGSVAPGKMGGHRRRVFEPHLTVRGLRDILVARGITVSRQAVWTFLRREGLRFKKNPVRS